MGATVFNVIFIVFLEIFGGNICTAAMPPVSATFDRILLIKFQIPVK